MADEENLTNALLKVIREGKKVVYFLEGHGEHSINNTEREGYSEAKRAIESQNYVVKCSTCSPRASCRMMRRS